MGNADIKWEHRPTRAERATPPDGSETNVRLAVPTEGHVQVAGYRDLRSWLDLAAEVEWFFGDMLGSAGFYHALLKNIERGTALCTREDDGPAGAPLLAGYDLTSRKKYACGNLRPLGVS